MGEVTKTRRTLIVPNQAIATYVTQWIYDSHNRLLEMIYPDEEKVYYHIERLNTCSSSLTPLQQHIKHIFIGSQRIACVFQDC